MSQNISLAPYSGWWHNSKAAARPTSWDVWILSSSKLVLFWKKWTCLLLSMPAKSLKLAHLHLTSSRLIRLDPFKLSTCHDGHLSLSPARLHPARKALTALISHWFDAIRLLWSLVRRFPLTFHPAVTGHAPRHVGLFSVSPFDRNHQTPEFIHYVLCWNSCSWWTCNEKQ